MTANARNTDPHTSHAAAKSVRNITLTQHYVYKALKHPRTDAEMIEAYRNTKGAPQASDSGLRSRRAELARQGLLAVVGEKKLESGRMARVWKVSGDC